MCHRLAPICLATTRTATTTPRSTPSGIIWLPCKATVCPASALVRIRAGSASACLVHTNIAPNTASRCSIVAPRIGSAGIRIPTRWSLPAVIPARTCGLLVTSAISTTTATTLIAITSIIVAVSVRIPVPVIIPTVLLLGVTITSTSWIVIITLLLLVMGGIAVRIALRLSAAAAIVALALTLGTTCGNLVGSIASDASHCRALATIAAGDISPRQTTRRSLSIQRRRAGRTTARRYSGLVVATRPTSTACTGAFPAQLTATPCL
mmetsp:Transcript_47919/g.83929  ORF Transcript_47919/g.83929 Transcript_47919/m.83929 type:complete len:265 (-) Transcript_47919:1347-2141(-)